MSFFQALLTHSEVKRGVSHLLVGLAIGLVSTALFNDNSNDADNDPSYAE